MNYNFARQHQGGFAVQGLVNLSVVESARIDETSRGGSMGDFGMGSSLVGRIANIMADSGASTSTYTFSSLKSTSRSGPSSPSHVIDTFAIKCASADREAVAWCTRVVICCCIADYR